MAGALIITSACLTWVLIRLLLPILRKHVLALPTARSSHTAPTPQGGGIAIVVTFTSLFLLAAAGGLLGDMSALSVASFIGPFVTLAAVGLWDDIAPLPVLPRLLIQAGAVWLMASAALGPAYSPQAAVPLAMATIAGVMLINFVNFMDGLDWMTVAEVVPLSGGLIVLSTIGPTESHMLVTASILAGALIGFAPYNKPRAKIFLGDVGSLPIGFVVAALLLQIVLAGHLVAALLLPLYYLLDPILTLLRRISKGEAFWRSHRSHFYQRATDRGLSVNSIVARVFALNCLLVVMAVASVAAQSRVVDATALAAGVLATGFLLFDLQRKR
jgi:UDP-N-acetylmuramyl pentapeptide phosphotransferase/UDP-N-acetylglucosamine-1-phosphate transferase